MSAEATQPSLYDRLGGIYSIACVVDDLIDRVMTDPRLNANPAVNEAHHKVPPPGFKYLVTEMVGWASGGPQKYTGRAMRESHEHLNITPKEWDEAFAGFAGIYGDRLFAFTSSASPKGFPYFTAREQNRLLQYRPHFRNPDKAARPINLTEAASMGANPVWADPSELMVDVETPAGKTLAIDDSALIEMLRTDIDQKHQLTLMRSERALTDCRPVSIFSVQSANQLAEEMGTPVDKRRFRANIYVDLTSAEGFAENELVGRSVQIGPKVVVRILERDPRCMMITLDPDTGEKTPTILKKVAQAHDGMAGVYGAVLVEGMLRKGDSVEVLE